MVESLPRNAPLKTPRERYLETAFCLSQARRE